MGLFDIFKKKPPVFSTPKKEEVPEETAKQIIEEFKTAHTVPSIKLTATQGSTSLTGSKLGGKPYFPKSMEYPCDKSGDPLRLLAQINWGDLPKLDNFPQNGILQFFISEDDCYGVNFDNNAVQNTFRIIYHPDILPENELADNFPQPSGEYFPFSGEFILTAKIEPCCMTNQDYRFNKNFMDICKKHIQSDAASILDFDDDFTETIWETTTETGHRIGGYPYFTQFDPRNEEYPYDTLLLQIDSDSYNDEHKYDIMWGDAGVANFFISSEDLEKLDFSNVLYTWDCC